MFAIFRHSLRRSLGAILGWGISLALLSVYVVSIYDNFAAPATRAQYKLLIDSYPPALMGFFGGTIDFFSPEGFMNFTYFSYMAVVIGVYAIILGSGMLAGDEEKGMLDILLAYPVSRTRVFFGRLAAVILSILAILAINWLGFVLPLPYTSIQTNALEMAKPFLSMFAFLAFFAGLSLVLSMLLPSQRMASMISGLLLVVSYFAFSLSGFSQSLKEIEKFFPLHYYQGGFALKNMNWGWFGLLIGFAVLFILLAWWRFERRDIRVSGEGGWRLPFMSKSPIKSVQ